MKKILALVLVLLFTVSCISAFAEEADDEYEVIDLGDTKYEQILQQKGILVKKEYIDIGVFTNSKPSYNSEEIASQMAIVTEVSTGDETYALRLVYSYDNGKYDKGSYVDVLDYDELEGIISALEAFKTGFTNSETTHTEFEYISFSGFHLAAIYDGEYNIYLQFNSSSKDMPTQLVTITFDQIDALIEFFKQAKAGMEARM